MATKQDKSLYQQQQQFVQAQALRNRAAMNGDYSRKRKAGSYLQPQTLNTQSPSVNGVNVTMASGAGLVNNMGFNMYQKPIDAMIASDTNLQISHNTAYDNMHKTKKALSDIQLLSKDNKHLSEAQKTLAKGLEDVIASGDFGAYSDRVTDLGNDVNENRALSMASTAFVERQQKVNAISADTTLSARDKAAKIHDLDATYTSVEKDDEGMYGYEFKGNTMSEYVDMSGKASEYLKGISFDQKLDHTNPEDVGSGMLKIGTDTIKFRDEADLKIKLKALMESDPTVSRYFIDRFNMKELYGEDVYAGEDFNIDTYIKDIVSAAAAGGEYHQVTNGTSYIANPSEFNLSAEQQQANINAANRLKKEELDIRAATLEETKRVNINKANAKNGATVTLTAGTAGSTVNTGQASNIYGSTSDGLNESAKQLTASTNTAYNDARTLYGNDASNMSIPELRDKYNNTLATVRSNAEASLNLAGISDDVMTRLGFGAKTVDTLTAAERATYDAYNEAAIYAATNDAMMLEEVTVGNTKYSASDIILQRDNLTKIENDTYLRTKAVEANLRNSTNSGNMILTEQDVIDNNTQSNIDNHNATTEAGSMFYESSLPATYTVANYNKYSSRDYDVTRETGFAKLKEIFKNKTTGDDKIAKLGSLITSFGVYHDFANQYNGINELGGINNIEESVDGSAMLELISVAIDEAANTDMTNGLTTNEVAALRAGAVGALNSASATDNNDDIYDEDKLIANNTVNSTTVISNNPFAKALKYSTKAMDAANKVKVDVINDALGNYQNKIALPIESLEVLSAANGVMWNDVASNGRTEKILDDISSQLAGDMAANDVVINKTDLTNMGFLKTKNSTTSFATIGGKLHALETMTYTPPTSTENEPITVTVWTAISGSKNDPNAVYSPDVAELEATPRYKLDVTVAAVINGLGGSSEYVDLDHSKGSNVTINNQKMVKITTVENGKHVTKTLKYAGNEAEILNALNNQ